MSVESLRSITQWFRRPRSVVAVATMWLTLDFLTLPRTAGVKQAVHATINTISLVSSARRLSHPKTETGYIVKHGNTIGLAYAFVEDDPTYVGMIEAFPGAMRSGWWAPTREGFRTELLTYADIPLTNEQWQAMRMAFADHMESLPDSHMRDYAQAVREGRIWVRRSLPWGYVRNTFAGIMSFVLLLGGCDWMLSRLAAWKDGRAIRRGCCPKCGYLLRYEFSAGCPECGWRRET